MIAWIEEGKANRSAASRDRQEQRAGARRRQPTAVATPWSGRDRYGFVHVRSRLQQDPNNVHASFSDGKQQWRESGGQTDAVIGSDLDEQLHDQSSRSSSSVF